MTAISDNPRRKKFANPGAPEPDVTVLSPEQIRDEARESLLTEERLRQEVRDQVKLERANADAIGATWPTLDLGPVFESGLEVPDPVLIRRSDGKGLFYEGLPNVIFGDPSAGKTAGTLRSREWGS
jgi:hypothetical protein